MTEAEADEAVVALGAAPPQEAPGVWDERDSA